MNELEKSRNIINEADELIIEAFKMRMAAVKNVIKYKKVNNLPILDGNREETLKKINLDKLNDKELEKYYLELLDCLLKVSKDYQKEILNA